MSFGISGDPAHSQMVGGDVAVAWVDKDTLKGYAVDYYLDAKSQCAGVRGSCPDERLGVSVLLSIFRRRKYQEFRNCPNRHPVTVQGLWKLLICYNKNKTK